MELPDRCSKQIRRFNTGQSVAEQGYGVQLCDATEADYLSNCRVHINILIA